jgi:DNA primase catalytic core
MNIIEEIKSRINIVDLVIELGLQLTQRNFIFSIYKNETNRSLKLYPETNSFYCFATGRGGDVIRFFADYKRIENGEAIKQLAKKLGLDNGNGNHTSLSKEKRNATIENKISRERCVEIYHSLENFCNGINEITLQYLIGSKRGLTEEIIKKFRLFSIKSVKETIDYLITSFTLNELKESGIFNEDGRFVFSKHKLIIPYLEGNDIIYLRGRLLPEDEDEKIGKYIGLARQKAKRLFNMNALTNLNDWADLLLCEGEFDTMVAHQQGFNAVGVPGINNFPEEVKDILKKYDLIICFDNDDAGRKGINDIVNKVQRSVNAVILKNHKDLTELLSAGERLDVTNKKELKLITVEPEKRSKLKLISAKEMMKKEIAEMVWIVIQLLPEGLIILAGRPKVGKSFMAMNIAIAVANGSKALGFFDTNKHSVLYVALEDNERRLKDRMKNILQAEYESNAPDNLFFLEVGYDLPKLNEGGIEELQKIILDNPEIKLIVIDTLGRSIADKSRKDRDMYRADYEISSKLQEMAIKNNICLLLLHHTKKGSEENVFDEISGTTGLTGAMDTMMVLKKKSNKCKLHVTGRDVQETDYDIEFSENTFTWNVIDKKDEQRLTSERQEIVDLLKKYDREMKTGEIAQLLGKEKSNISKMLKKLIDDEILTSPKYGTYKIVKNEKSIKNQSNSGDMFS